MLKRILHCLAVSSIAFLFNFSAIAADDAAAQEQAPWDQALIDDDKKFVDSVLEEIFNLLRLQTLHHARLPKVAELLQNLITLHRNEGLGTKKRRQKLDELHSIAWAERLRFSLMYPDTVEPNLTPIDSDPNLDVVVKSFLDDYFKGVHQRERVMVQLTGTFILGGCLGVGGTRFTYLSGEQWLGPCVNYGIASVSPVQLQTYIPVAADVSLQRAHDVSDCDPSQTRSRLHRTAILGLVNDIKSQNEQHADLNRYSLGDCQGVSIGLGILEVSNWIIQKQWIPLLGKNYDFPRERLRLTYDEASLRPKSKDS